MIGQLLSQMPTGHALAIASLMTCLSACSVGQMDTTEGIPVEADAMAAATPSDSCEHDGDCLDECPPGSNDGCGCATTAAGDMCAPTCLDDADCPSIPRGALVCDAQNGFCVPALEGVGQAYRDMLQNSRRQLASTSGDNT